MMVAIQAPAGGDANAYAYADTNRHGHADCNSDGNGNSDCHSAAHSNTKVRRRQGLVQLRRRAPSPAPGMLEPESKEFVKNLFLLVSRARERNDHLISARPTLTEGSTTMSKITLTGFALLSVLFFANASGNNASQPKQNASEALTGTLQKMIVENASVTMQLDLNGLNGSNSLVARPVTLHFAAAPNSFFPVLVFNDLLRGLQPGLDGTGFAKLCFGRGQRPRLQQSACRIKLVS